jgi:hypothetical protein
VVFRDDQRGVVVNGVSRRALTAVLAHFPSSFRDRSGVGAVSGRLDVKRRCAAGPSFVWALFRSPEVLAPSVGSQPEMRQQNPPNQKDGQPAVLLIDRLGRYAPYRPMSPMRSGTGPVRCLARRHSNPVGFGQAWAFLI